MAWALTPVRVFALSRVTFAKLTAAGEPVIGKLGLAIAKEIAVRLDDCSSALAQLMQRHESTLDTLDQVLTDKEVQKQLFGTGQRPQREEFDAFKDGLTELVGSWNT